jgi:chemotaxis protein histidine kinase CheA
MYLKEGFDAFLAKPIDYKKLEALIAAFLDESLKQPVSVTEDVHTQDSLNQENESVELPMIEGLDWRFAKQNFNDRESLLDAIQFFANTLEIEATTLSELFANVASEDGQTAYRTKVHSMKNSAATIGIIPLAGMAKVLEDAARNGELDVLEKVTPVFLSIWYSYKNKLASFIKSDDNVDKKNAAEHLQEVNALLAEIRVAAGSMDIDALDELWKQLEEYHYDEVQQDSMKAIQKAILEFDIDFLQALDNLQ